ncbi:uncharacterized protein LOC106721490 isoform X1 [Papilio machaon]|uniref:uncharacterized protein LOC106721490 isoform X1 n=1 Tax=Papilio machaon TaxID=76193 RepID=UPI001E663005|nr:uncharacterized protein LOC106721490 isoform X1 [Papilio machaon]
MPPKSKRIKNITTSKENTIDATKAIQKSVVKNAKVPRKALADKTNSASDDNDPVTSPKIRIQTRKMKAINVNTAKLKENDKIRPKRNKKLRDISTENQVLNIKSNKPIEPETHTVLQKTPVVILESMQQVSEKVVEKRIADSRPKRICRLPSKFDDHFISPSKCIPVQPIQASTPIVQIKDKKISAKFDDEMNKSFTKKKQQTISTDSSKGSSSIENSSSSYNSSTEKPKRNTRSTKRKLIKPVPEKQKASKKIPNTNKKQADTNNNAKDTNPKQSFCNTSPCRDVNKITRNRIIKKDYSFRLFDEKKDAKKRSANNLDVYEFTYDPAQEPPPPKKKRKRVVKKNQEKPKHVLKTNYDKNIAKSLADLKNMLSKKTDAKQQTETPVPSQTKFTPSVDNKFKNVPQNTNNAVTENVPQNTNNAVTENLPQNTNNAVTGNVLQNTNNAVTENVLQNTNNTLAKTVTHTVENGLQANFNSFNVEDIVLNDVSIANDYNDLNYSPVNSPDHVRQASEPRDVCATETVTNNDPLNIQEDISFFDDIPVASSSMNVSTRNPSATPWRAEYEQLPIKWQVNTYVKPNMTPAFECSFINFNDKKKHVYTNMVPEDPEPLPEIIETETPSKLKQTSIISFFKEVVEKQTRKKLKTKTTPVKDPVFDDHNTDVLPTEEPVASNSIYKTPQKTSSKRSTDLSDNKENSTELVQNSPTKSRTKKSRQNEINKDVTFFGFDESEEQENVSPIKKDKGKINALRPRSRAVLQEFNVQKGPIRMPLGARNKKDRNAINKVFDEVVDIEENLFQEKAKEITEETNNPVESNVNISPEDSQSVHLFEDLEVVHSKPPRKSYGKAKKVAFRHHSESSDTQEEIQDNQGGSSGEEDNLEDLTFEIPTAQTKRLRKKKKTAKQRTRKEDKEAEEWAAGFNSMCEDIDHFDLIVE